MCVLSDLGILAFSLDKMELFKFIPIIGNKVRETVPILNRPASIVTAKSEQIVLIFDCQADKADWIGKIESLQSN